MKDNKLKEFLDSSHIFGTNAYYIEDMYDHYLEDPNLVDNEWKNFFENLGASTKPEISQSRFIKSFDFKPKPVKAASENLSFEKKQVSVLQLINAHRFLGVRVANTDPLNRFPKPEIPELTLEHYNLSDNDLETSFSTGSLVAPDHLTLREILSALRKTYCSDLGLEYMYISDIGQKRWLQDKFESVQSNPNYSNDQKKFFLERLTSAETLEKYLHTKFVGQKRFSLEGGEAVIVALDHLIQVAGDNGVQETVIGMAHRGRLNVLVNTLGKLPKDLFSEFEGVQTDKLPMGDVKYHQGFSSDVMTPGGPMHVSLAFNPSHLEIVNPVVEGSVKARQQRRKDKDGKQVLPVLLHGDSAFAGQGVVMETLNLSQTRGYGTGGTVHIIVNNQIGFTTSDVRDTRSTPFCTDVAKMLDVPVFHVNGDNADLVAYCVQVALEYRQEFGKDVVVDIVCYRKLGHNEQDEPMVTQPLMYSLISKHPGSRKKYASFLEEKGVLSAGEADELVKNYRDSLDAGFHTNKNIISNFKPPFTVDWSKYIDIPWTQNAKTTLSKKEIEELGEKLTEFPDGFKLHSRVNKIISDRKLMIKNKLPLDWGMAENLAYASLLKDGYGIRISGQDAGRGTFFHRHAVMHDQNRSAWSEGVHIPLENIASSQGDFTLIDSILSEEAVLGFEYGFATAEPNKLVVWEAQFGDFANGAQVVIDQFIASGEVKWGRVSGLVMMLPHGYEGQGQEHSSARIERYLQLCADYNMQICIPSTPSQMFHLIRRQMIRPYRKPLIIISPKSMLRHKRSVSDISDFIKGKFEVIIGDVSAKNTAKIKRIVVCSGKIYYELLDAKEKNNIEDVAIIRIEQLYPFPHDAFEEQLKLYKNSTEVLWCQEEPGNQGAWHRIQHYLKRHLQPKQKLIYSLRKSSASPAVGYLALHNKSQNEIISFALNIKEK